MSGIVGAVVLEHAAWRRVPPGELRTRVERLSAAGIHVGLVSAHSPADPLVDSLVDPLRADGPGLVLAGELTDLLARIAAEGVGHGLVLRVDATAPLDVLDRQLTAIAGRRVPGIDPDPRWTLAESGRDPIRHRVTEALFTLGAHGVATRGSVEEALGESEPLLVAAGVYAGAGTADGLLHGPTWTDVVLEPAPVQDLRVLDLRTGVLHRTETDPVDGRTLRSLRFATIAEPHVKAMRMEAAHGRIVEHDPQTVWRTTEGRDGGGIGVLSTDRWGGDGDLETLERLAAVDADSHRAPRRSVARDRVRAAEELGFDRLLCEHRRAWARRWDAVDVRIPDAPADELGLRYALFQLWGVTGGRGDLAVGARGLSGPAYRGHVFWDADVFVLPALLTIDPTAARRMVDYRLHRLDEARAWARRHGRPGARFPWESGLTGADVTPVAGRLGGEPVPIRTGSQEEHITADVAWAVVRRASWSSPRQALRPRERELLAETARYWADRCRTDLHGRAHVDGVIGPDEYHESVDDNTYTNALVRWNLEQAADLAGPCATADERAAWRDLAARLVLRRDPVTGVHEQFAGYFALEPLTLADVAPPPVAADVLLGPARIAAAQIVKQPDVLMLHHLLPSALPPGSLAADLDFYVPRTAHGSSLSPAITAAVLARGGRPDEALELLRVSLAIDLHDLGGTTASGTHLGAAAGAWQAVLSGFLGADVRDGRLVLDPVLPAAWPAVEARFRCLGADVRVAVDDAGVRVAASRPLGVLVGGEPAHVEPIEGRIDG